MSKFNQKAMGNAIDEFYTLYPRKTLPDSKGFHTVPNCEGAPAYAMTDEMSLYTHACTTIMNGNFYKTDTEMLRQIIDLVKVVDHTFVAKLAVYCREEMNLRSIPIVLVVELAKIHNGDNLVSDTIMRVVRRVDEITELLSYYQASNKREGSKKLCRLSNQVKKGIRRIFESGRFGEYGFAKYNRKSEVRVRDALFLTHPKPQNDEQKELFEKITNNTLETPYTWETQLSETGVSGKSKTKVWEELIDSGKLGYMAMLRNVRNFLECDISERHIKKVCGFLSDYNNVVNSKQLPFRFLSAYRSIRNYSYWGDNHNIDNKHSDQIVEALNTAIEMSIITLPVLAENVLIATDVSASMMDKISPHGSVTAYDIGAMMAMLASKTCTDATVSMFGSDFKVIQARGEGVLDSVDDVCKREGEVGYSTHGYKVIDYALNHPEGFDNIMIFTDCQLYGSQYDRNIADLWNVYSTRYPNAKLYIFDLVGHGTSPVQTLENNVYLISGWSDKVFDLIEYLKNGQSAIDMINSIKVG